MLVSPWLYSNLFARLRSEAESLSLVQDGSQGWLCVRFASCGEDLVANFGIVGVYSLASLHQSHALKIKQATIRIIQEFCSPSILMPLSKKERTLVY